MFKNILVATDGSDLAAKAVEQGILFAKEVGAKIIALTVTEPFNVRSLAPSELEYTPIEYKNYAEAYAEEVLGIVSAKARSADKRTVRCWLFPNRHRTETAKSQSALDGALQFTDERESEHNVNITPN